MAEQAYNQAVEDIKDDLLKEGKCFLAFRKKLNPVMEEIVREYADAQSQIKL